MRSNATTVKEYLASLPEDRRAGIEAVRPRKVIFKNLDAHWRRAARRLVVCAGACGQHSVECRHALPRHFNSARWAGRNLPPLWRQATVALWFDSHRSLRAAER